MVYCTAETRAEPHKIYLNEQEESFGECSRVLEAFGVGTL